MGDRDSPVFVRRYEELLGTLRRRHLTDQRRAFSATAWPLAIGSVLLGVGVAFVVHHVLDPSLDSASGTYRSAGRVLGLGLLLVVFAGVRLVGVLRRRGEFLVVCDNGFVQHRRRRGEVVRWSQVAAVRQFGAVRSGGLCRALGLDHRCVVRCSDKQTFGVNTFTREASGFAGAVLAHLPRLG